MLRVVVGLLCCLLQAVEASDENVPLLAGSDRMPIYSGETWRTKIKGSLAQENHVSVFYFPKEGERYSVTYDVNASLVRVEFVFKGKRALAIVPLTYALHQELLHGYVLRSSCFKPCITDADFSEKDVDLRHYCRQKFFARHLDYLLTECLPRLADQGKGSVDNDEKALTANMLKEALPIRKSKRFFWQVVYEDDALDILGKTKKKPEVLLIVGGVGMLWGRLTNCLWRDVSGTSGQRSLFHYKVKRAMDKIRTKYPFSLCKLQYCLNYSGENTVEGLRADIKKNLTQKNHVRVFYFSEKDECCSVAYNISAIKINTPCIFKEEQEVTISVPFSDYLHQALLGGYVLKPGLPVPNVRDVDFSEKDVDLENYDREPFFSEGIDDALVEFLPNCDVVAMGSLRRLNRKGKVCADKTLTAGELRACITDMRAKVLPKKEANQHFSWNVVHEDEVMEILYEVKKEPEVLLVIGGVGILWGNLMRCFPENIPARNCRSLLHYKMGSVLKDICAKYGRPQEAWRSCAHDIETNTQETVL